MASKTHTIESGESIVTICERHKYRDWEAVIDHPANKGLKEQCKDPSCLPAKESLTLYDKKPHKELGRHNSRTVVKVKKLQPYFILCIKDHQDNPQSGIKYDLIINGETKSGETGGDGIIEEPLTAGAKTAELTLRPYPDVPDFELTRHFKLSELQPHKSDQGPQQRLAHRGIASGPPDGDIGPVTTAALKKFQGQSGLNPTGKPDAATQDKIKHAG